MKRILSLLLLAVFLLSAVACADDGDTQETTATPTVTTTPGDETTAAPAETEMTPELPTESFGGLTLTITGDKAYLFNQAGDYYPLYVAEEQTGELINEAVIKRDRLVEERLGVELVYRAEASTDYFKTV